MISFIKRNDVANAQGLYAVRLRVCKERQRRYFALNIFADEQYWDADNECFVILKNVRDKKQKEENEKRKQYNYLLSNYRVRAQVKGSNEILPQYIARFGIIINFL